MSFSITRRGAMSVLSGAAALGPSALAASAASAASSVASVDPGALLAVEPIAGGVRFRFAAVIVDVLSSTSGAVSVIKRAPDDDRDLAGFFIRPDPEPGRAARTGSGWDGAVGPVDFVYDAAAQTLAFSVAGRALLTDRISAALDRQAFELPRATELYGLGQFRDPLDTYREARVYLAQANMDAIIPTLVSPDGWGLIWDTGTHAFFSSEDRRIGFDTPEGALVRYHLLHAEDLDGLVRQYRRLTGRAPIPPRSVLGFWQSQERYVDQDQLLAIAHGYAERDLPIDVIVQDWSYWGEASNFSGMSWDPERFPDPAAMAAEVHGLELRLVVSIWPAFGPDSAIHQELDSRGLLFPEPHWSGARVADFTHPDTREIYWRHIEAGLMSVGVDGLWTDGNEPEFLSTGSRHVSTAATLRNGDCSLGPLKDHLLTFSYHQAAGLHAAAMQARPDRRPFILTRSAYAGQQAFNAITWSGDIFASWRTLTHQILAAQQVSLAGIPYWTTDIGAFLVTHRFPEGLADPAYRELYVRWFQFGALLPVFRAHGTQIPRHVWAMHEAAGAGPEDPFYQALLSALRLRYALMPYIYAQAARVTFEDEAFIRPLAMDFADDPDAAALGAHYMFGRDLLARIVDIPLLHAPANIADFIPNWAVTGPDGEPAALAEFYDGPNFDRHVETRLTDDIKTSWFGDLPLALRGRPYSVRWRATITPYETGLHRFVATARGGLAVWLDGAPMIAAAGSGGAAGAAAHGAGSFTSHEGDSVYAFEAQLEAGRPVSLVIAQTDQPADLASLWFEWETPSLRATTAAGPDATVDVYLPRGTVWRRLGSAEPLAGGQTLALRPEIGESLIFARAGTILVLSPGLMRAARAPERLEIQIYPGADGRAEYYDDAGDGHGYLDGEHRRVRLSWADAERRLTLAPAQGAWPGQPETTPVDIVLLDEAGVERRSVRLDFATGAEVGFGR